MIVVRDEAPADAGAREALLDRVFGPRRFAKTCQRLRDGCIPAEGLALAACRGPVLVGTLRLWDVAAGPARSGLLLGPLAVAPEHRREGIGSRLMRTALDRAAAAGHGAVLLVGDPRYYERFGFTQLATEGLWLPGPYDPDRFLGLPLRPGALAAAAGLVAPAARAERTEARPVARSAPVPALFASR